MPGNYGTPTEATASSVTGMTVRNTAKETTATSSARVMHKWVVRHVEETRVHRKGVGHVLSPTK